VAILKKKEAPFGALFFFVSLGVSKFMLESEESGNSPWRYK
jgi:hypothetical protein